jgi:capsular exopolysaccharide synthesis family protein
MKVENQELFGEESGGLTIKDYLNKYFSYWPLFAVSLLICVGSGILYLKYTVPKYTSSTLILVKQQFSGGSNDLVETAISGGASQRWIDIDNQMATMITTPMLERVVLKNTLNISYYYVGKVKKTDIYLDAPFRLIPGNVNESNSYFVGRLKSLSNEGGVLEYGEEKDLKQFNFKWNNTFKIKDQEFTLARKAGYNYNKIEQYEVIWQPAKSVASDIAGSLMISLLNKNTSILKLELVSTNIRYAQDVLNGVFTEFNQSDIEDRNVITQNSIRFIDDRLNMISRELSGVEGNLENYQGQNQLINVQTQSSQSFDNANTVSKDITNVNVQQGVVNMIRNYFNSPSAEGKLVPSTLGLDDPTLSSLITKYNELQIRKQKEAPSVAAGSTVMQELNDQLTDIRGSILESLQNLNKNLQFQQNSLEQQNSQYRQFLSSLPRKERAMQEIKRKQGVTEGLYLYLLQKREEAAISSTSASISNYKQIEPAKGYGPTEPLSRNIYMYTILLGLFIPVAIVYLKDLFNDKVITRSDILKKVPAPILGDINHMSSIQRQGIAINGRDIIGEQFRIIRTNLSILLNKKENAVILVTSTAAGEGKSTISTNLAAALSLSKRKVALLEFDLRKPVISALLELDNPTGLSDYISGTVNNLEDIYTVVPEFPNLHIFSSGDIGTNPADLLLSSNLEGLFKDLKEKYDYIIVDSAPTALVSDAFILAQYSDVAFFVIRQRKTLKKQLEYLKDVILSKKIKNVSLIFNDIKTGGKTGYYGYGGADDSSYNKKTFAKKGNLNRKKEKVLPG